MPRKARDERLDTRTARLKLAPRPEPYWRNIQEGRAVGYRRLAGGKAGKWIARHYDANGGRKYDAIGVADDMSDADGVVTLSFAQAQEQAAAWFLTVLRDQGRTIEPLMVREAVQTYLDDYTTRGGKALAATRHAFEAHILPALGDRLVPDLTLALIRTWHHALANAPARLRSPSDGVRHGRTVQAGDAEGLRARRATANRVLTCLKACLNHAYAENRVQSDDAWRRVKPFSRVDAPRIRHLDDEQSARLVNACQGEFRQIVSAALLTGMRYGEIIAMRVADFDAGNGRINLSTSKSGKPRLIHLTDEGREFFGQAVAGKAHGALVFRRADGDPWGRSHQFRLLRQACERAKIVPAISFHILRHTYASRLLKLGASMSVVAQQIGDSEAIAAKHYAHLAPDHVGEEVRRTLQPIGLSLQTNVVPISRPATA